MSKRLYVIFDGDKIMGDSPNAIASRIASYSSLTQEQALEYVTKALRREGGKPSSYQAPAPRRKKLGLSEYVSGAEAVVKVSTGASVDQLEINRRAGICQGCDKRTEIPGCMGCGFAGKLTSMVNKIKTFFGAGFEIPSNLAKNGCGVCDCSLAVMLPAKTSAFKNTQDSERPDHCWVKTTSNNYIETP